MSKAERISRSSVPQVFTPTKVRNPVTFFRKRDQCSAFFTQLALVFSVNATSFPDDKSKVIYAITNMGAIALKYFQSYLTNLDTSINLPEVITNYQVFKKTVIETFGDSNPAVNAETMLRNLKHVGPVSIYATEFRQISMDLTWNDSALMALFKLQL
ncbi:hypothetical protein [Parasitella parasitica]|uniref:Retrotransposon gag domain-containing protein n=1 Tax=Parasitella parasitica TaxID=35722 RepID=A0A0B7MSQ5_9FUNG|nr:hypothetical protein [Parasitella parasitica]